MHWNWQQPDWPRFRYDAALLAPQEGRFLQQGGVVLGSFRHLAGEGRDQVIVEIMSTEAIKSSQIEGEILDRDSVQSSIRRQLGLATDKRRVGPAERGIAAVMVDLYRRFAEPLEEATLFRWHGLFMR
jgi:Fic family protein